MLECKANVCNVTAENSSKLLVGYSNGMIDLLDFRISKDKVVSSFNIGSSRILNSGFLPNRNHEFVTANSSGSIMIWDIRQKQYSLKIDSGIDNLDCFDVHEQAPLFACGSTNQNVQVMNMMGQVIGKIKSTEQFLSRTPLTLLGLAFHPRKLELVMNTGNYLSTFGSNIKFVPEF
jgi:WD40 repeat protein